MLPKVFNFQIPKGTADRFRSIRKSTGLSHAVNLAWGWEQWVSAGCSIEGVIFSEETPGRTQKVLKLPAGACENLALLRKTTGLPLWRLADGALFFCGLKRPPSAITVQSNPLLAAFSDEVLRREVISRGYRMETT